MSEAPAGERRFGRRAIGVALCLCPVLLAAASLVSSRAAPRSSTLALGLALVALALGLLNAYLSFVRPRLVARRAHDSDGSRHVSGLPLLGSLLVVASAIAGFGDWRAATIGLVALLLDTGGAPWFLWATWRDTGFWDE